MFQNRIINACWAQKPHLEKYQKWQLGLMFEQDIHVRTISSFRPFCSSGVRTFSSSIYYYICSAVCFIAGTFLGAHMLLNWRYSFTSKCLVPYDDKKSQIWLQIIFPSIT